MQVQGTKQQILNVCQINRWTKSKINFVSNVYHFLQYSKLILQITLKQWKILSMWEGFRLSRTVCLLWLIFTETLEKLYRAILLEIWWRLVKESFTKVKVCDLFQGTLMSPKISFLNLGILFFLCISPTEHSFSQMEGIYFSNFSFGPLQW